MWPVFTPLSWTMWTDENDDGDDVNVSLNKKYCLTAHPGDLSSSSSLFQAVVYTLEISTAVWSAGFIIIYTINIQCLKDLCSWKQKANLCWKKPETISSSGKLLVSWTILRYTELDNWFLFEILSLCCPEFTEFSLWPPWRFLHFMLTTIVLIRFICKNLVTFGRAKFARRVGDVSLLHSPLSMRFYLTDMPTPCVVHDRHKHCSLCSCLHPCWAISSGINSFCVS